MFTDVIFPHKKKNNPVMTVSVFKLASEKKKNKAIKISAAMRESNKGMGHPVLDSEMHYSEV